MLHPERARLAPSPPNCRMKSIAPLTLVAALAGCASFSGFEPATPPDYTGPTVNVADQARQVSGQLLHVFEMTPATR